MGVLLAWGALPRACSQCRSTGIAATDLRSLSVSQAAEGGARAFGRDVSGSRGTPCALARVGLGNSRLTRGTKEIASGKAGRQANGQPQTSAPLLAPSRESFAAGATRSRTAPASAAPLAVSTAIWTPRLVACAATRPSGARAKTIISSAQAHTSLFTGCRSFATARITDGLVRLTIRTEGSIAEPQQDAIFPQQTWPGCIRRRLASQIAGANRREYPALIVS
jgi:hypothetical protein